MDHEVKTGTRHYFVCSWSPEWAQIMSNINALWLKVHCIRKLAKKGTLSHTQSFCLQALQTDSQRYKYTWPENPVQYLIFLTFLILDQNQQREENRFKDMGSYCCISAACNPHYLCHTHVAPYNLCCVITRTSPSSFPPAFWFKIFFLRLLNLLQSFIAILLFFLIEEPPHPSL